MNTAIIIILIGIIANNHEFSHLLYTCSVMCFGMEYANIAKKRHPSFFKTESPTRDDIDYVIKNLQTFISYLFVMFNVHIIMTIIIVTGLMYAPFTSKVTFAGYVANYIRLMLIKPQYECFQS